MEFATYILLATFLLSLLALLLFIVSMSRGMFGTEAGAANMIFAPGERGRVEDPSLPAQTLRKLQSAMTPNDAAPADANSEELQRRTEADRSSAGPALLCLLFAVLWLLVGSMFGLIASLKMHLPDWLTAEAWLTFGRMRSSHLNVVAYGWSSMAGVGVALWLIPRLLQTPLRGARYAYTGIVLWNVGVLAGVGALLAGWTEGLEWLEFPWQIDILLFSGGALMGMPLAITLLHRRSPHLYVSVWYMVAALLWFPVLFFIANIPGLHFGVQQATMNWWYGHNALGLWFTPLGLAAAYYFIPKILGKPIHSYNLSLLGFWGLAFFYSQVGGHHLIGGPVPSWFVTISIVQSVMMLIPVIAVAINQHMTVLGSFRALLYSPTLRFIVLGAMMYTVASVQGSLMSFRGVNTITHFTHYTVAHAHIGLYGFFAFVMFGSMYFILPRIMGREWPHPRLIGVHFWLVTLGIGIYFVGLSIGGWLQGQYMLDAARSFSESVAVTKPYLASRSVGGLLMTLGHLVFAVHILILVLGRGPQRTSAARLRDLFWLDRSLPSTGVAK